MTANERSDRNYSSSSILLLFGSLSRYFFLLLVAFTGNDLLVGKLRAELKPNADEGSAATAASPFPAPEEGCVIRAGKRTTPFCLPRAGTTRHNQLPEAPPATVIRHPCQDRRAAALMNLWVPDPGPRTKRLCCSAGTRDPDSAFPAPGDRRTLIKPASDRSSISNRPQRSLYATHRVLYDSPEDTGKRKQHSWTTKEVLCSP